jgi:acetyl-CoA carboxylase carboxyl transferase subunit beta
VSTRRRKPTIDNQIITEETEKDLREFLRTPGMDNLGDKKRDMPEGIWIKCSGCGATLHAIEDLEANHNVCPKCQHHHPISAPDRVELLVDAGSFVSMDDGLSSVNALGFKGYVEKVKDYAKRTGMNEAVLTGRAQINGIPVTLGVMDFRFLGASMGSVVGEKLTRAIEVATRERRGCIIISSSGGARMHEGILSLMQMGKTSGALARHHDAGLPFISVLTHPTTGGVTASFATLGDIILAEPKCMIGFAGPRVVKETTHQDLPPGFQTAEFMVEHGLVDRIVHRAELRDVLTDFLGYMMATA